MDIETCIRDYLTSGEFNHEAYHPARDFLSGLLDITIVKPVIEFFTGTDLITGERLTEAQKYQKMAGAIVDMFTFGQGLVAMKGAGLVGKELCKAFGKTMLVEVASSASAYTVGYGVEAMGLPPQIAWMLGAATGCIVSTAGMNLVFRNPKTGVVRECSLEEITSLEKLDASEIDIAKLGKEVPTDDLELYMRYQKEGSIEHFTDSEKKTISRIETMGIKGDECEEILRARGREVNRPPREEPEAVLPPRNESEGKGSSKADVLAQNRANGRAFEQQEFAKFSSQNNKAVEQITVKTPSGVRTRVDAIGLDVNGNVVINEYKSSLTAPLTNNQKAAFPEILERGATVVGKGKGIFTGGYQIPPGTEVKIIRPE